MVLGKLEMVLSMTPLEKRVLLLDNRGKSILFEDIPDCLGTDRVGEDAVNEMGSLNSIVKLSSGDLVKNGLFVPRCKLGRATPLVVFLV